MNNAGFRIQTVQKTKSDTPFQIPNFNLSPAAKIGISTALALSALGGFLLLRRGHKKSVPESAVLNHKKEFDKIVILAKQVQKADHEKFTGREFITYLQLKIGLISSQEDGLYKSIRFLKVAISSKRFYDQIFVVETQYLSRKQQEFYRFADNLISQSVFGEDFRQKIEAKLTATLPDILKDEGKKAIQAYAKSLVELSHCEYGLELLAQFKRYEMSSYSAIRTINDLVDKFMHMDLTDSNVLLPDIMLKIDALEQLTAIVGIPKKFVNPDGFVKIFHFITLEAKQEDTARQFKRLLTMIGQWRPVYRQLQDIRRFYNPKEYWLPKEFSLKIPGEDIFAKYKALVPQIVDSQEYFIEVGYRDRNDFGMAAFF